MTVDTGVTLELHDIQAGALRARPTPYAGAYVLLRIDHRGAGRELLRRLVPVLASAADPADPGKQAWVNASLSFQAPRPWACRPRGLKCPLGAHAGG